MENEYKYYPGILTETLVLTFEQEDESYGPSLDRDSRKSHDLLYLVSSFGLTLILSILSMGSVSL